MLNHGRVAMTVSLLIASAPLLAGQRPVAEQVYSSSYKAPPATVAEMVALADAVVVARYTGVARVVDDPTPPFVYTIHGFQVVDVVKAHQHLPVPTQTFEVRLNGGTRDRGSYLQRATILGVRPLVVSDLYVVFLEWNPKLERYGLAQK